MAGGLKFECNLFKFEKQHINGAEAMAVKKAYQSCRLGENPLHWGVYVSDQDSSASLAVQEARVECGESRESQNQICFQHLLKGSHRQLNRNLNVKEFSVAPSEDIGDPIVSNPDLPFRCSKCGKGFKSAAGRGTHVRFCSKLPIPEMPPPTTATSSKGMTAKEAKPFKRKLLHWVMVRKNAELKRGVAMWRKMRGFQSKSNLEMKHRLKKAAGTILPYLKGNHKDCQYSFVCSDAIDPFRYLLPRKSSVSSLPGPVQKAVVESIWSVFNSEKLDKLIKDCRLRTTSVVEATHRTIRNPVPKGKSLPRNQTSVLQLGASVAALDGKGLATMSHFRALNLPVSSTQAKKFLRVDRDRRQNALCRKTVRYQKLATQGRRAKFESHGRSLETKEASSYRKDGFTDDHSYSRPSTLYGELHVIAYSHSLFILKFFFR